MDFAWLIVFELASGLVLGPKAFVAFLELAAFAFAFCSGVDLLISPKPFKDNACWTHRRRVDSRSLLSTCG